MFEIKNLSKTYRPKGAEPVYALKSVSVDFGEKGLVFILGKSGSGKSTLLHLLGGLLPADEGEIIVNGVSAQSFSAKDYDDYRNEYIGFVFQDYNLLTSFTVGENLAIALELQGKKSDPELIEAALKRVELEGMSKRKPLQLSGGQRQRVAIARALIKDPAIILADEPTGALDNETGKSILQLLKEVSRERLVIVVSHDREFAQEYGDRIVELSDGRVVSDTLCRKEGV